MNTSNKARFQIFANYSLAGYFNSKFEEIKNEIRENDDNYILNVNEREFIDYLISKYSISKLILDTDHIRIDIIEKFIPADQHPRQYDVGGRDGFLRDVTKCYIPFSGNDRLLNACPDNRVHWTIEVTMEGQEITFGIINWDRNPDDIRANIRGEVSNIKTKLQKIDSEIDKFNGSIEEYAFPIFSNKKQKIIQRLKLAEQIGIPVIKRENASETFSIPVPEIKKKIVISKPETNNEPFKADPAMDDSTYESILKLFNDVGKQLEKMPHVYEDKDEETIRDFFLLFLEPNFEGSATGETFNKSGKTDILLKFEGSNAFIAECKYWQGKQGLLEAIDQLLGYLTWRDSKSAIVLFVKNKSISKVLEQIISTSQKHSNYLSTESNTYENWFNIRFHTNDDPNREIKTAILVYHVPQNN